MGPVETAWTLGEVEDEVMARVKPELNPGERLIWAARSREKPTGSPSKLTVSLTWAVTATAASMGSFFAIFGRLRPTFLPAEGFVIAVGLLTGLVGLISSVVVVYAVAERTERPANIGRVYALTDQRGIIWKSVDRSSAVEVYSYRKGTVQSISRLEYPDGSGDVRFTTMAGEASALYYYPSGFEGVDDARQVEELVRRTLLATDSEAIA